MDPANPAPPSAPAPPSSQLQPPPPELTPPRVNPVGIVEPAAGQGYSPRPASTAQRWVVWIFLAFFATATVATSILSLGAYCLTSDGADTRALHAPVVEQPPAEP